MCTRVEVSSRDGLMHPGRNTERGLADPGPAGHASHTLPTMLKDFKAFILRGNVLDLAVAFVLGLAFASVISTLVDLLTNVLAIPGKTNFTSLHFTIGGGTFRYGAFMQALINFVLIAAV